MVLRNLYYSSLWVQRGNFGQMMEGMGIILWRRWFHDGEEYCR